MEKKVIELFAGVGGFRVGLNGVKKFGENGLAIETNNWDFVWANQWEPSTKVQHAYDCYCTRFGISENHSNQNISEVDVNLIPDHSLLVGGFPCQDYSVARTLSGEQGINGKKGVLFWDIANILEIKKTPFVLLENVDRLLKSPAKQRGRDFGIMLRTFYDKGYNVEWRVINAADYGCPQKRKRVFIFAWKRNLKYNNYFNNKSLFSTLNTISERTGKINQQEFDIKLFFEGFFGKEFPIQSFLLEKKVYRGINLLKSKDTVEMTENFSFLFENAGFMIDGIAITAKTSPLQFKLKTLDEVREKETVPESYFLNAQQIVKFKYLKGAKKVERIKPNGDKYKYSEGNMCFPDSLDKPGRTMLTSEASINRSTHVIEDFKTKKYRFITPIEAERLQTFPDNWTNTGMPNRRRYFMMGNALVTEIINKLENQLTKIIEGE